MARNNPLLHALAEALIHEVPETAAQVRVRHELESAHVLLTDPVTRSFLLHGKEPFARKAMTLRQALEGKVSQSTLHVLLILLRKGEMTRLPAFLAEYVEARKRVGITREVVVRTAAPLSQTLQARLKESLARHFQLPVTLRIETDPSLISGIVARSGDWSFDASARGRLNRLQRNLLSA